jgi:hypothetical protein
MCLNIFIQTKIIYEVRVVYQRVVHCVTHCKATTEDGDGLHAPLMSQLFYFAVLENRFSLSMLQHIFKKVFSHRNYRLSSHQKIIKGSEYL